MRKRPERSLLDDLNNTVAEPEMASIIGTNSDIEGPSEEADRGRQRMNSGKFADQSRLIFVGDMESGTCNVCSAPCSSCMHRIAVAMESDVDCGSSDNTFQLKEADNCSFTRIKGRLCDDPQTAVSETSNLLSGNSSNDSYSENAESKATLRSSFAYDTSEDADIPQISTVEAVEGYKFLGRGIPVTGHGMSCRHSRADVHHGELDGEHNVSRCYTNNDSCITGAGDANMLGLDHNLELEKRSCSLLSTCKFGVRETEMVLQVKTAHESCGCNMDANQIKSRKLNTFPQESSRKKSPGPLNVGLPSNSDLTNTSLMTNISPKLDSNSPCQSDLISSHNADSNDIEANQPSQVHGESHDCLAAGVGSSYQILLSAGGDHGQKSVVFSDSEATKSIQIGSNTSSGEFKNGEKFFESASDFDRFKSNLYESGTGQTSELESMLYDVKVCDICGDAGREDLLASCSRCIDGAEHTYCMRIMLDEVPERDWLCEECQKTEDVEIKKVKKAESVSGTSNICYLNKKIQNFGSSVNPESSPKLDTRSTNPEACGSSKQIQSPRTTSKKQMDRVDGGPITKKKASETSDEPLRTASPRIATKFSRESSFKNLHMAQVKQIGDHSANSSQTSRLLTLDRENSFKNLHMAGAKGTIIASLLGDQSTKSSQTSNSLALDSKSLNVRREPYSPRGFLSKQVSFKKSVEPKVKQLVEGVSQKLAKNSTSSNTKQMLIRTINRSASCKSVSSGHHNVKSLIKAQSLKTPRADPKVFNPKKERNVLERKSSFDLDRQLVSPPPFGRKPLPKLDVKIAPPNSNASNKSELSILCSSKGFDRKNNLGFKEVKKQSSFKWKGNEICDSENKKPGEFVNKEAILVNSAATYMSCSDDGEVTRSSVSPSIDSSHQANLDDTTKDFSGTSRSAVTGVNHVVGHVKLTEAKCCQIDRHNMAAAKPSVDVGLVDGTNKRNKWKDAVKASISKNKMSRRVDQFECKLLKNNIICEGSSRSSLTSSSCQKDSSLEGAPYGKVILRVSDTDNGRTDIASDAEQTKHLTESSYVPGVGVLNVNPTNPDELNEKSSAQILPDHPSLLTTDFRFLVVPEHKFIWQGDFEILRIGGLTEIVEGIQAHLSNFASPKVHEVACQFPCNIQLEEVPRVSLWPLQFQETGPKEDNIGLYFFAKDAESYEKSYQKLLDAAQKNDLAFKGSINEVELLIFPSNVLPESSQRWNMLFFLWGIFKARKQDSSKPYTNLQQEPSGSKITLESQVQELSSYHACELSTFLKHDLQQYPPKEFSIDDETPGARTLKFNSIDNCQFVSSTVPDNDTHKTEDFPSVKSSLDMVTVETESNGVSDHTHFCYSFDYEKICPASESNGTKSDNDVEVGKTRVFENSVQQKLDESLPEYLAASGFRKDKEGTEESKGKKRLVKIEDESEENFSIWGSKPSSKCAHSFSTVYYGESSKSTIAYMLQEATFVSLEGRDHKRMKCDSEGHVTSLREQSTECRLPPTTQQFLTTYVDEQQRYGIYYNNVMPESSICTERCFFPQDSFPVGIKMVENFRYFLPPVDKDLSGSRTPDLELALGGKKLPSEEGTFPLFLPSVDKGRLDEPSGSEDDDSDVSTMLSLSIASPATKRRRIQNPIREEDQHSINTTLNLFETRWYFPTAALVPLSLWGSKPTVVGSSNSVFLILADLGSSAS
ncbi:hypothetical protein OPV22_010272 [Ensete ventricosum]|uniref:PHD-type domain-containing protein n=1 Tax=Ensete ventricosum TaxID=4639 RepID=A0AAV8PTY5_ENSVE|nr:hypothetical protein OPV22_010272 [Ensete ventricosum]